MRECLHIVERRDGELTILELSGQLVALEGALTFVRHIDALIARGALRVIVNLQNVTYIDSGGVGALVAKFVSLLQRGGALKLACLSGRACRVLRTAGLLEIIPSFETEDAARRSFASAGLRPAPQAPGGHAVAS